MPTQALTPETRGGGEVSERKFDPRSAAPFVYKSTSEETRRAYGRTPFELFRFDGMKHPADVSPDEVLCWHDQLRSQRRSAATVSFKLSVVRSFFEHLRAAGAVTLNPAATRLVPPPEVSSQPAGRALTIKEVRYLLAGPGEAGGRARLRADARHAAPLPARLGGLLAAGLVRYVEPRAVDVALQGQGREGGGSPLDLRRTAITKALDSGLTYRQVQMMSEHRDSKTVMRYDHGREKLDQNTVNFLGHEDEG